METQGLYVDKFYEMDPQFEDLLPTGDLLKDGMVVLLEDSMHRADVESIRDDSSGRYEAEKAREANRWCTVSNVHVQKRYNEDEYGHALSESSPLISFVATYGDGTKKKRRYCASFAWLVKLDSMPDAAATQMDFGPITCENPECPMAGRCGGACAKDF